MTDLLFTCKKRTVCQGGPFSADDMRSAGVCRPCAYCRDEMNRYLGLSRELWIVTRDGRLLCPACELEPASVFHHHHQFGCNRPSCEPCKVGNLARCRKTSGPFLASLCSSCNFVEGYPTDAQLEKMGKIGAVLLALRHGVKLLDVADYQLIN